ncbi:hypothetical protein SVIO_111060 [Streptomyces violaceusniger]|uniref:Uncharacterized protein n=1 Tax=Streptomyces violaceusniger TaxID=68280 RepID=A0A4D4LQX3_STRVO|nr:hypothetical protein SVIO_111060 [Streptomyces violaceusniger]
MTPNAVPAGQGRGGLLKKLLAAVRAEFRTEIYRPAPTTLSSSLRPAVLPIATASSACEGSAMAT